jgi:putative drug exporter of the RND superfamily
VRSHPATLSEPTRIGFSTDGKAAVYALQVKVNEGNSAQLRDAVKELRHRVSGNHGGLQSKVTVAGLIALLLLVVIYRLPVFWLIPLITVLFAESTSRGVGYAPAKHGVTINGQSGGVLPVLVLGAGTDYALLLVSRYREELRRFEDKHQAMPRALATAGPAIVASALTVICALFTLTLAQVNGTKGLGPIGAMGVGLAAIFMLTLLPALLVVCGRRAFWPFVPHVGDTGTDVTHGPWRRIGERVRRRPCAVWVTGTVILIALAAASLGMKTNLTSGNSFRGSVEAVQGQNLLQAHFPAGLSTRST